MSSADMCKDTSYILESIPEQTSEVREHFTF